MNGIEWKSQGAILKSMANSSQESKIPGAERAFNMDACGVGREGLMI